MKAQEIQLIIKDLEARKPANNGDYIKIKNEKLKKEISRMKKKHDQDFKIFQEKMNINIIELIQEKDEEIEKYHYI